MPIHSDSFRFAYTKPFQSVVGLILLSLMVLPFVSCSESGNGTGPLVSSLATSTEKTASVGAEGEDENQTTDPTENETQDSEAFANIAEPDEQEDPAISLTSTPTGVTARLTWDTSTDPNVSGYRIYYGKQSSGEYGSCSYEGGQTVETPPATIDGLEPNTPYFFAISAYGGEDGELESPCSTEVLVVTPAAPQT
jgi:Fibronectin type III domain